MSNVEHTRESVKNKVIEIINQEAHPIEVEHNNDKLKNLGLDSLDIVKVSIDLENEFNINNINDKVVEEWSSVKDVYESIINILEIE